MVWNARAGVKRYTHSLTQEDNILREAVLEEPELKWTIISQIMQEKYGVIGRTGKQCR